MNFTCLIAENLSEAALAEVTGCPPILRLEGRHRRQSLILYSSLNGGEVRPLPESRYKSFTVMSNNRSETAGGLSSNDFDADLELHFGIDLEVRIEPDFLAFLDDNPFMAFKNIATREIIGDRVQFRAGAKLGSRAFRDARHELPTFALRSGEDVTASVYTEVFDEDGRMLRFGAGARPTCPIAQAVIVFSDPITGRKFRISADTEPSSL